MNEENVRSFIKEDISLETISLMKAMLDKSMPSRTLLLNELDIKLQDVLTRSGKYGCQGPGISCLVYPLS